ncbi:MAG: isopentenyl-diphosphate Delta-isomerase [Spirosomaceae bacterium]|nr:isopentenyl-diphosphate Delta-isomerase [Spirosomataceae bacterium]
MISPIYIELVDENDNIIGSEEKLLVHQKGLLHRAFSILIYNEKGEMLIHQRAFHKYHCGGLWTNACCGHPNKGETMQAAVHRRLQEEMGFDCELELKFKFQYKAEFANGLTENEIDHVYVGKFNGSFIVNSEEVADYKWINVNSIREDAERNPENYTVWFKEILQIKIASET